MNNTDIKFILAWFVSSTILHMYTSFHLVYCCATTVVLLLLVYALTSIVKRSIKWTCLTASRIYRKLEKTSSSTTTTIINSSVGPYALGVAPWNSPLPKECLTVMGQKEPLIQELIVQHYDELLLRKLKTQSDGKVIAQDTIDLTPFLLCSIPDMREQLWYAHVYNTCFYLLWYHCCCCCCRRCCRRPPHHKGNEKEHMGRGGEEETQEKVGHQHIQTLAKQLKGSHEVFYNIVNVRAVGAIQYVWMQYKSDSSRHIPLKFSVVAIDMDKRTIENVTHKTPSVFLRSEIPCMSITDGTLIVTVVESEVHVWDPLNSNYTVFTGKDFKDKHDDDSGIEKKIHGVPHMECRVVNNQLLCVRHVASTGKNLHDLPLPRIFLITLIFLPSSTSLVTLNKKRDDSCFLSSSSSSSSVAASSTTYSFRSLLKLYYKNTENLKDIEEKAKIQRPSIVIKRLKHVIPLTQKSKNPLNAQFLITSIAPLCFLTNDQGSSSHSSSHSMSEACNQENNDATYIISKNVQGNGTGGKQDAQTTRIKNNQIDYASTCKVQPKQVLVVLTLYRFRNYGTLYTHFNKNGLICTRQLARNTIHVNVLKSDGMSLLTRAFTVQDSKNHLYGEFKNGFYRMYVANNKIVLHNLCCISELYDSSSSSASSPQTSFSLVSPASSSLSSSSLSPLALQTSSYRHVVSSVASVNVNIITEGPYTFISMPSHLTIETHLYLRSQNNRSHSHAVEFTCTNNTNASKEHWLLGVDFTLVCLLQTTHLQHPWFHFVNCGETSRSVLAHVVLSATKFSESTIAFLVADYLLKMN